MRLIDADKLMKSIPEARPDMNEDCRLCTLFDDEFIKELIDNTPTVEKVCGYPIKDLVVFAIACREQDISEKDLRGFVLNAEQAYEWIWKMMAEANRKAVMESLHLDGDTWK